MNEEDRDCKDDEVRDCKDDEDRDCNDVKTVFARTMIPVIKDDEARD